MAKTKAPLQSFSASGALAKTMTYRTDNGRNIVSMYTGPNTLGKREASALQKSRRELYFYGTKSWNALSQSIKNTLSETAEKINLSGFNLFIQKFLKIRASEYISFYPAPTPNNNNYTGIAWSPELGLFCAVSSTGSLNRVMTSPDGINWTPRTTPNNNGYLGIAWSPELGLFCAVSATGSLDRVMTSPDGINWTPRTTPNDNNYIGIAWSPELGLFCAVAVSGTLDRAMTSPDGINWTPRTTPNDNYYRSVAWSPELGLFCAVSSTGSSNRVMHSDLIYREC
jgi:hypothetical protein